jgi:hypothetical protein
VVGEVQAEKGAPSRAHSKLAPAGSETKPKFARVDAVVAGGRFVSSVSSEDGGTVRIAQSAVAGEESTTPSLTARTSKECRPSPRSRYARGEVQVVKGESSSEHSNVALGLLESKLKVAIVAVV